MMFAHNVLLPCALKHVLRTPLVLSMMSIVNDSAKKSVPLASLPTGTPVLTSPASARTTRGIRNSRDASLQAKRLLPTRATLLLGRASLWSTRPTLLELHASRTASKPTTRLTLGLALSTVDLVSIVLIGGETTISRATTLHSSIWVHASWTTITTTEVINTITHTIPRLGTIAPMTLLGTGILGLVTLMSSTTMASIAMMSVSTTIATSTLLVASASLMATRTTKVGPMTPTMVTLWPAMIIIVLTISTTLSCHHLLVAKSTLDSTSIKLSTIGTISTISNPTMVLGTHLVGLLTVKESRIVWHCARHPRRHSCCCCSLCCP
mmetsp:Transcript_9746/g.20603  ORF Transcript_9746/g.20603 Transcript_9746/m.20603 type:complete len:323 (-) Transcript_9746:1973-2941(-)